MKKNMAQMDKWIAEFKAKLEKKKEEKVKREEKNVQLLQEAREYYGYRLTAKDPKFRVN